MKKILYILLLLVSTFTIVSCESTETYSEKLAKERAAISQYIADSAVTVISETQFANQNYTTDVSKNEFVLFQKTGVYMQIIRGGCGEKIKTGETCTVLCRFSERNLLTDSLQLTNNILTWAYLVDKMSVTDNSGTFTAAFMKESSLMYTAYKSTSVPSGWLVPFTYIKIGRPESADEEIAKVRLIVPAAKGQYYATLSTYPCLYDLTFERGI